MLSQMTTIHTHTHRDTHTCTHTPYAASSSVINGSKWRLKRRRVCRSVCVCVHLCMRLSVSPSNRHTSLSVCLCSSVLRKLTFNRCVSSTHLSASGYMSLCTDQQTNRQTDRCCVFIVSTYFYASFSSLLWLQCKALIGSFVSPINGNISIRASEAGNLLQEALHFKKGQSSQQILLVPAAVFDSFCDILFLYFTFCSSICQIRVIAATEELEDNS